MRNRGLSVGNVVSLAVVFYRSHLQSFLGIALLSSLWSILPFLVLFIVGTAFSTLGLQFYLLALLLPLWLVLLVYCLAKSVTNAALISRLVFQELISSPESVATARHYLQPRLWSLFFANLLVGLVIFAIYLVYAVIIFGFIFSFFSLLFNPLAVFNLNNFTPFLVIFAATSLLWLWLLLWFAAKLFLVELPLATADNPPSAGRCLGISWQLTKKNTVRVTLIIFITFLLNLPLAALVQFLGFSSQSTLGEIFGNYPSYSVVLSYAASYILGTLGNLLVLPLWQGARAVTYYDLKNRRQGLDLNIADHNT